MSSVRESVKRGLERVKLLLNSVTRKRLTTLWAFTACYRDRFTFYLLPSKINDVDDYDETESRISVYLSSKVISCK
jgi:hypothetical protein